LPKRLDFNPTKRLILTFSIFHNSERCAGHLINYLRQYTNVLPKTKNHFSWSTLSVHFSLGIREDQLYKKGKRLFALLLSQQKVISQTRSMPAFSFLPRNKGTLTLLESRNIACSFYFKLSEVKLSPCFVRN